MGRRHNNNYSGYYKMNEDLFKEEPKTPEESKAEPEEVLENSSLDADEYTEAVKEALEEETLHIPEDLHFASVVGEPKKGVVVNCERVNVRTIPSPNSAIASIILLNEEVDVDLKKSTDDYYAVTTSFGIDGFIKKDFIKIL